MLRGPDDFTPPFAKLGRDKLKAERLVDIRFARRRNELSAAIKPVGFKLKPFTAGESTQLPNMRSRTGRNSSRRASIRGVPALRPLRHVRERGGLVEMQLRFPAALDGKVLQDFSLQ